MNPNRALSGETLMASTPQELAIWATIHKDFAALHTLRGQSEGNVNKVNKAHEKVKTREATNEPFTVKAGYRLLEMYQQTMEQLEAENKYVGLMQSNISSFKSLVYVDPTARRKGSRYPLVTRIEAKEAEIGGTDAK
jgi:hypothetical protein